PNGETVVLGGIFRNTSQDNESGLPWLRSVPVLGWLFKHQLRSTQHEELLVFLSPKIVATGTTGLPSAQHLWEERKHGGGGAAPVFPRRRITQGGGDRHPTRATR